MIKLNIKIITSLILGFVSIIAYPQFIPVQNPITKIAILGSGNPNPDPDHSGCSVAIIVNEKSYIIDFGPGLVRQASKLSPRYGGTHTALSAENLKIAFLTHLHSDHTTGYPDLILTPWVLGRDKPLEVYGPEGIKHMTEHILEAYREDIRYRLYGLEPANNQGWRVNTHEIEEGLIYTDEYVKVEAFKVEHGSWPNAFGFRFTTPDKVIVISGDAMPSEKLQKYAENADILIHEVYSKSGFDKKNDFWKAYHSSNHTSTLELAELANKTKPGMIILYHTLYWGASDQDLLDEIATIYKGKVVVGLDGQVY
ncbi:MAG: MBL fold metallo-hydrolase [Bacteroidetes bacterium]|nr:MBL fold metallo-hydrolase [Bacteroidota bacterium]